MSSEQFWTLLVRVGSSVVEVRHTHSRKSRDAWMRADAYDGEHGYQERWGIGGSPDKVYQVAEPTWE